MPINVPTNLPAIQELKKENIFIMEESRAIHQDIRPLRVAMLNLMPVKMVTETDLLRSLVIERVSSMPSSSEFRGRERRLRE